jgi:hypothetical protein
MRRIERTGAFRRDFKREKRGQHRRDLDPSFRASYHSWLRTKLYPRRTMTMDCPATGTTIANATSNPICY